jgi:hypothetical protein
VWAVLQIIKSRFSAVKADDCRENKGMVSSVAYLVMKKEWGGYI